MDSGSSSNDDTNTEENIYTKIATEFKNDIIKETLKLHYNNVKSKIDEEAVELMKEVTKIMVIEAAIRAAKQASLENKSTVAISHVEMMLPQLMLDFP